MNPRIHEIIGTLQLLNEELQHNQGSGEVLGKIKLFSAQLYLETDMELIAVGRESLQETPEVVETPMEPTSAVEPSSVFEIQTDELSSGEELEKSNDEWVNDSIEEVEVPTDENAQEDLQNAQPSLFGFEPEMEEIEEDFDQEEEEDPVFEEPKDSGIELIFKKADSETTENQLNADSSSSGIKEITPDVIKQANEVLSMFSLSRRFEFANFLFGGDMQKFTTFICEMILAQPGDEREDVYESWYQRYDWRRRDESASDLKRNLRKMM